MVLLDEEAIDIAKPSHHLAEIWHSHLGHHVDAILKRILICNISY